MNFQTIKANLITILGTGAAGRYRTVGYQRQRDSAKLNVDDSRSVQVFYTSGNFPKSGAGLRGPIRHEMTFRIELIASKAAVVDVATLESATSTEAQKATALAAMQKASSLADDSIDELFSIVYNVLMDNAELDLGPGIVAASRWIGGFNKDAPHPRGDLVTMVGSASLTCTYFEEITGEGALNVDGEGVIQPTTIDVDIVNDDDTDTKQGVQVTNAGPE